MCWRPRAGLLPTPGDMMLIRLLWTCSRKLTRLLELWHKEGFGALLTALRYRMHPDVGYSPSTWLKSHRPSTSLLETFRAEVWPSDAPTISVLVPVYNTREDWLREMVASVRGQTYPHWQLVLANDASPSAHVKPILDEFAKVEPRITVVHLEKNRGVSAASNAALAVVTGEYVCFLDHDDALEPHALHRLAKAILSEKRPDLLYTDEAITGPELNDIIVVRARPAFSYDYYLNHPYFVHLIATKTELARNVGGWDESMNISQDVDLVLRLLTVSKQVTHIPDVLYRWRTHPTSLGHQQKSAVIRATSGALTRHLNTVGMPAEVRGSDSLFNVFEVRYPITPTARVCILIPTKNQVDYLRDCIDSLERTIPRGLADIVVIDHASDDKATQAYLEELRKRHRIVPATGPFNFSAIMNVGVKQIRDAKYTHYLFLNNDITAPRAGWLERMLELGCRADIGCVGATLVYPDDTVQHAGVVVGLGGAGPADHAYRSARFSQTYFVRAAGDNGGLVCNRDYSATTAACMLMRTEVFEAVGGFDEKLAVGYNDTDLCLRVKAAGYKVVQATDSVLIHYESKSRGKTDKHPTDTALFLERYAALLASGDPYFNPLLRADNTLMSVLSLHPAATAEVSPRTVPVVPPKALDSAAHKI